MKVKKFVAENKHTPAPWFAVNYGGYWNLQEGPFYSDENILDEEKCPDAEANANLMASAPELLEALRNCVMTWEALGPHTSPWLIGAKEAIANATGKQQP